MAKEDSAGRLVAGISGEVVKVSGQILTAKVSGETVLGKVSGETLTAKISGEAVEISGEVVRISGEQVRLQGYELVSSDWRNILVNASGQIIARISGDVVKMSGEAVKVSGEAVKISGEAVKVSGETVSIQTPTTVKTGNIQTVTGASGGQVLHSGAVKSVIVKANTANSGNIAIGGSTDRPWYEAAGSGQGLILDAAEAASLDVDNFDAVYVVAEVSGDKVSFLGIN